VPSCNDVSPLVVGPIGSPHGSQLDGIFRTEGFGIFNTPVRTPVAHAFAQRWIGSIRRELLDRTMI